jgi:nucleoside-diphosphate-sugar epimerase
MGWPMFVKTMVEGAVRGEPVRFESGGPYPRAYTYIEDLVDLMVRIVDAPDEADRVFYGSNGGELTTASQIAGFVRDAVPGADVEIGDTLEPQDRYELQIRKRLSIENAREQLGFEPRYTNMRDGVAEYVEHYRDFVEASEAT